MQLKLTTLWVVVLAISLLAASANAAERWRLVSVPLDMPLDDQFDLDGQALEGLYQGDYGTSMPHNYGGYIGHNLQSSGLNESPFYRINSTLKDGRDFELWFSSAEAGRKVFGVRLNIPYSDQRKELVSDTVREIEAAFGKPDLEFRPADMATQEILVIADRTMPKQRYDAVVARLPKSQQVGQKDADSFWNADLRQLARFLGPEFRGAVAVLHGHAKNQRLASGSVELLDLKSARTVFNLDQPK